MTTDDAKQHINVVLVDDEKTNVAGALADVADEIGVGILIKTFDQYDLSVLKLPNADDTFDRIINLKPDVLLWVYHPEDRAVYRTLELLMSAVPAMGVIFVCVGYDKIIAKRALRTGVRSVITSLDNANGIYQEMVRIYAQLEALRDDILPDTGHHTGTSPSFADSLMFSHQLDDVLFTAYTPQIARATHRHALLMYAHLDTMFEDIHANADEFIEKFSTDDDATPPDDIIKAGTPITVIPESDSLTFEPASLTQGWQGDWSRYVFEFTPSESHAGDLVLVRVSIQIAGIQIANIRVAIDILTNNVRKTTTSENPLLNAKLRASQTKASYDQIFVSYAREDQVAVDAYHLATLAFGDDRVTDTYAIHADESDDVSLAQVIDQAEIFHLFWSEHVAHSQLCRAEWAYALKHRCPDDRCASFIRPISWDNPLTPAPPDELAHLTFYHVSLKQYVADSIGYLHPPATAQSIAIYSTGTGAGTTTLAINTAISLAHAGYRTLLIDCDIPFSDVGVMLNIKTNKSFADLIDLYGNATDEMVQYDQVIQQTEHGVDLLLPPKQIAKGLELLLRYPDLLLEVIYRIEHHYDYIILDMSSTLDAMTANLLDMVDRILLVTTPTLNSIRNTRQVLQIFKESEFEDNKTMIVLNKTVENHPIKLAYLSSARIERFLNRDHIEFKIPKVDEAPLLEMITQGEPFVTSENEVIQPMLDELQRLVEQLMPTVVVAEDE